MRKLTVTAAAVAALFVPFSGAVSSADTLDTAQVAAGKVFGPFGSSGTCKIEQEKADVSGWKITAPCHRGVSSSSWYFKAVK
jgi:hypothetical protein